MNVQIWRHKSGDMYVVEMKNSKVNKVQGALYYKDIEKFRETGVIDNQPEDIEWMNEYMDDFITV